MIKDENRITPPRGRDDVFPVAGDTGIIQLDTDLGIVSLDAQACCLMDLSPESLAGRKFDEVADLENIGNLIKNGISFSNQIIVIGSRRIICDYDPIMEEDLVGGGRLTLHRMIDEDVAAGSDELKEILRSANAFMNYDHDGIIVVDHGGTIVLVNQAFARLLDSTPQAILGRHVDKAYLDSQPSHLLTVMETGKPEIGITHYFNGKQVYASRFPLVKDGKVIGCMGKILFNDVREIGRIAQRLRTPSEKTEPRRKAAAEGYRFKYDVTSIVGQSSKISELKEVLLRVARKNSNVLLNGESGTGKELFAHALHAASDRRYAPFVMVNCAAIPEHLLESELFGYTEGAFTGARKGGQTGKFEQAHTGTIFLDEIGDMPLYMQAKMLRVLQEKELTQLGCTAPKTLDVRVVAATNSNLEQLVEEGRFREDLYYRLKVVTLSIPPLRERIDDIYPLTKTFIDQFNSEFGLDVQGIDPEAWSVLMGHAWPGNVRELRNVVESAFNVVTGPLIERKHLPEKLSCILRNDSRAENGFRHNLEEYLRDQLGKKNLQQIMEDFEKVLVTTAVELSQGNKNLAARLLGISRQWLHRKMQKHHRKKTSPD